MTTLCKPIKNDFIKEFSPDPTAYIDGTYFLGYIDVTYPRLERFFRPLQEDDGYKSSGHWIFKDINSHRFTIYDCKSTELYDSDLPSIMEFRTGDYPESFILESPLIP